MKYVSKSSNKKISSGLVQVDATYNPIKQTCPDSCELKGEGCYASQSFVGMINSKLEKEAEGKDSIDLAKLEAEAINNSYNGGKVPEILLRLHVSGESPTVEGTKIINKAVGKWLKRGGSKAWSYTHCWKDVPRKTWSNVSVLASIDDYSEIPAAIKKGYVPAIVVSEFPKKKKFSLEGSPVDFIPCPAQVYEKSACDTCQLCMRDDMLKKLGVGIAFEAHSIKKNTIKKRLTVIN